MRLIFLTILSLTAFSAYAQAQSLMDNLPPVIIQSEPSGDKPPDKDKPAAAPAAESYSVADVNVDVTADTAAHARDRALVQAERTAYSQLCGRLGTIDNADKLSDDNIAALVRSFEVQSEHLSAVRYVGVFTITFTPAAVKKKLGAPVITAAPTLPASAHMTVAVKADTLAALQQVKKRITAIPLVANIDTLDLGKGLVHIDVAFNGSVSDFRQAAAGQGFILRESDAGVFELYDGVMPIP
jgi:hypothetical protein